MPTPARHMTQITMRRVGALRRPWLRPVLAATTLSILCPVGAAAQPAGELGTGAQVGCAPTMILTPPDQTLQIVGSQDGDNKYYYGPADTLIINGGTADEVRPGQEFFVRRISKRGIGHEGDPVILTTAGWIRIVAADEHTSIASVIRPCTGLQLGDFLAPFDQPALPATASNGEPDYSSPGQVLFGLDGRQLLGEGHYIVVSLGSNDGMAVGQRLTIFRNPLGEGGPVSVFGSAVVVRVDTEVSTVRLVDTRDAVESGDLIAPHR